MNKKENTTLISFNKFVSDNEPGEEMLILESTVQNITYKMYAMLSDDRSKIIIRVKSDTALPESHPINAINYTTEIPPRKLAYDGVTTGACLILHCMSDVSRPDLHVL